MLLIPGVHCPSGVSLGSVRVEAGTASLNWRTIKFGLIANPHSKALKRRNIRKPSRSNNAMAIRTKETSRALKITRELGLVRVMHVPSIDRPARMGFQSIRVEILTALFNIRAIQVPTNIVESHLLLRGTDSCFKHALTAIWIWSRILSKEKTTLQPFLHMPLLALRASWQRKLALPCPCSSPRRPAPALWRAPPRALARPCLSWILRTPISTGTGPSTPIRKKCGCKSKSDLPSLR